MKTSARANSSDRPMPATPLDILAEELGAVAGRIEREAGLRIEAAVADLRRIDAERELRLVNLERSVADRLAAVRNGESVTIEQLAPLVAETVERAVAGLPVPKDGESVTVEQLAPLVAEMVAKAVAALPAAKDGESVTVEQLAPLVAETVERAVAGLPAPKDGESVTVEQLAPLVAEVVDRAVEALPKPENGKDGKLPIVKEWSDRVHYAGEVVTFEGSTYQAGCDTGRAPPHDDWVCIAAAGQPGADARSPRVRETWSDQVKDYRELEIVALNGAGFIARRDNPGPCPGDGWQIIAMQGKPGKPGERVKGDPGPAGPRVASIEIDDQGLLTLANADGSTVACDLYPLLSKLQA